VLWDKKKKTIVNNESSEIIKMFNDEFNNYAKHPHVNLYTFEKQYGASQQLDIQLYQQWSIPLWLCNKAKAL
jgi:glutathionyl-hydroquinone reductase